MTENSLLGHVSPIPALTFVLQNREKVKVRPKSLSDNLFGRKVGTKMAFRNLGLAKMASATPGVTKDRLTWFSDWYLRGECDSKMLAEIVNYHHRHPFSLISFRSYSGILTST